MARPKGNRKVAAGKNASGRFARQAKNRPKELRPVDRRVHASEDAEPKKKRERSRRTPDRELIAGVDQRMWLAVWMASMIAIFGLFLLGYSFAEDVETSSAIPARVAGFVAAPVAFFVLAFVSKREQPWRGFLTGFGVFLAIGGLSFLPYFFGASEVVVVALTLPMALGAGGAYALRNKRPDAMRTRMYFVVLAAVVGFVLFFAVPELGIVLAPSLPFPSLILADFVFERRLRKAEATA